MSKRRFYRQVVSFEKNFSIHGRQEGSHRPPHSCLLSNYSKYDLYRERHHGPPERLKSLKESATSSSPPFIVTLRFHVLLAPQKIQEVEIEAKIGIVMKRKLRTSSKAIRFRRM